MANSDSAGWFVVATRPAREMVADHWLRAAGVEVYVPLLKRRLHGARLVGARRVRCRGPGQIVLRPLFPRYLFARGQVATIVRTLGVDRVLTDRASGEAQLLPDAVLAAIREAVDRGEFDEIGLRRRRSDIKPGDTVRTASGIVGELIALDEHNRATVLLEILAHRREVAVADANTLAKIATA